MSTEECYVPQHTPWPSLSDTGLGHCYDKPVNKAHLVAGGGTNDSAAIQIRTRYLSIPNPTLYRCATRPTDGLD